jgi:hypothetical protein
MSPSAGQVLVDKIAPRLRGAIPHSVHPIGGEDAEELVQDSIAIAAQMLHNVELAGKTVTPGNIAYYAILHMKSGRRSGGSSRVDVMAAGTQLDQRTCVLSLEEQVGYDAEIDEAVTLGELLASSCDDPSMIGARNVDWDEFLRSNDSHYGVILQGIASGKTLQESAVECGIRPFGVYPLRHKLAQGLREYLGAEAISDAVREPSWKSNITADRERNACRASR